MKKFILPLAMVCLLAACGGGSDKKEKDAPATPANSLSSNPDYQKGLQLISESRTLCLTCHKIDENSTGPAYRNVANKYENTEANVKMLAEKVKKGGSGVWGTAVMPPNANVTEEEATALVKYILLLKK